MCVCVDGERAVRCHKAISAAVTVVGHGSRYLKRKEEAGGTATATRKIRGLINNG